MTFLQTGDDLTLLLFQLCLDEGFVGDHNVLVLLVDFHNLELHLLSDILVVVTDWLYINLAARQECLNAEHIDDQAAFGAALDGTHDDFVVLQRAIDLEPSAVDAGRAVRHHELTIAVFLLLNKNRHCISNAEFRVVTELRSANHTFGLVADVDDNFFLANADDRALYNFRFTDEVQAAFVKVLELNALFRVHFVLVGICIVPVKLLCGSVQNTHYPWLSWLGLFY